MIKIPSQRIRYNRRKKEFDEYKLKTGCKAILEDGSVCGWNKHVNSLGFHHINPAEKKFNITQRLLGNIDELMKEFHKTRLLCQNCHGIETAQSGETFGRGITREIAKQRSNQMKLFGGDE